MKIYMWNTESFVALPEELELISSGFTDLLGKVWKLEDNWVGLLQTKLEQQSPD